MKKRILLLGAVLITTLNAIEPSGYICSNLVESKAINDILLKGKNLREASLLMTIIFRLKPNGKAIVYGLDNLADLIKKGSLEWQDEWNEALITGYHIDWVLRFTGARRYILIDESGTNNNVIADCKKMEWAKLKEFYKQKSIDLKKKYNSPEEVKKRKIAAEKQYKEAVKSYADGYANLWNSMVKQIMLSNYPKTEKVMILNSTILNNYHKLSKRMQKDISNYLTKKGIHIPGINQTINK